MSIMTRNDEAWIKLFEKYRILEQITSDGRFIIKADEIKEFREPRLMTKFDHMINLPKIFKDNHLSILPLTRGTYVISSFLTYEKLPKGDAPQIEKISAPLEIQSLTPQNLISETMALNYANICEILDEFLEDEQIVSTVNGRMGGGNFKFNINLYNGLQAECKVSNPQIEIDAAYEGRRYLTLFEAKREVVADDFLIRQLYYPFRTWRERVTKTVKSVFMVYADGVFDFYQYNFEDPMHYNSLYLAKRKRFIIETEIALKSVIELAQTIVLVQEDPKIPFPQADRMSRVISLLELLNRKGCASHKEITENFAFDARQTDYYTRAGAYLGFVEIGKDKNKKTVFRLSPLGKKTITQRYEERQLTIIKQVLQHKIFNEVFLLCVKEGKMPERNRVVELMKAARLNKIEKEETYRRRAGTITGWINWILELVNKD
ncbi:MAG: hypothetical protein J6K20_07420 [Thermoguttaceae bacterium]|nr:hypothetical protein [Thermoguttaceae bacterium]